MASRARDRWRKAAVRPRLFAARHGKDGRARAEFLLRHRPDRALRRRPLRQRRRARGPASPDQGDPRRRQAAGREHVGRLRLPHRSQAASIALDHAGLHGDERRRALLRIRRPDVGARRAHQGPPAGRPRGGGCLPRGPCPLRLAPKSRLRRHRRHPRHVAQDPGQARPVHRRRVARPRPQARPRRHPRDRVLRPDPAADHGRSRPLAPGPRDHGRAGCTDPRRDHRRGDTRPALGRLPRAQDRRAPAADDGGRPDPFGPGASGRPHAACAPGGPRRPQGVRAGPRQAAGPRQRQHRRVLRRHEARPRA